MHTTPPPLPSRRAAIPPPLPKSGCQNGCVTILVGGVCVIALFILVVGMWGNKLGTEAEAAKVRLKENLKDAEDKRAESRANIIPGLAPVDIYLSLEEKGFKTNKDFKSTGTEMLCQMASGASLLFASIKCPPFAVSEVLAVDAVAESTQLGDSEPREFLGFIATAPYDGANPVKARTWLNNNFGSNAQTEINGVLFELSVTKGTAHRLRLSPATKATTSNGPAITGWTLAEVISKHGEPTTRDKTTGWAVWPTFQARFEGGAVVEAVGN